MISLICLFLASASMNHKSAIDVKVIELCAYFLSFIWKIECEFMKTLLYEYLSI
jgi:hypothetical protein